MTGIMIVDIATIRPNWLSPVAISDP